MTAIMVEIFFDLIVVKNGMMLNDCLLGLDPYVYYSLYFRVSRPISARAKSSRKTV